MENMEEREEHHKEGQSTEKLHLCGTNGRNWDVFAKMNTRRNLIITSRGMKGSPTEYEE